MGQFADIRPYNNEEVASVLNNLLADDELVAAVASLKLGPWHKAFTWLVYPIIRFVISRQLRGVSTVEDFQHVVKGYMDGMIESTTTGLTVSGLDALDPNKPYLFMSNHRDITMDPAFVTYALYHNDHDTVRIAIGDNLLTKPYVSDLMRLNKSFIVKRSAKGPRQILAAYKMLSSYIRHSIEEDNNPIWIAQREGRAKDGNDRTEPAIIKMLAMSQQKQTESLSDYINKLHIVPVSISYELDPCDGAKAKELYETATHGEYQKDEHEDVESIAKGIAGNKGNVHVSFGVPLEGEFDNADAVADAIDRQVVGNYVLHSSNFFAYKLLHGHYPEGVHSSDHQTFSAQDLAAGEAAFSARINALPAEHREFALGIYANTIDRKKDFA
ncbi:MAG: 1-acyl-sn-glycerol-3-phosphate acyltransferase [Oceanicoccus sp.]|uniref:1-acyl-sn-glycerol-3-phosphate acyltransferase n=2 Tax=Oceanicoccus sp. TaxID=2691044 RepID=UPI0026232F31|nr:1-acyl-sn-glycerol-3-phosphate acyltransferase [Oceanicoccus sp.]MDG1773634.1 1-acyl-sn-glycerol-3-phosphate acyltransferase [Oceanicoccus sp.]